MTKRERERHIHTRHTKDTRDTRIHTRHEKPHTQRRPTQLHDDTHSTHTSTHTTHIHAQAHTHTTHTPLKRGVQREFLALGRERRRLSRGGRRVCRVCCACRVCRECGLHKSGRRRRLDRRWLSRRRHVLCRDHRWGGFLRCGRLLRRRRDRLSLRRRRRWCGRFLQCGSRHCCLRRGLVCRYRLRRGGRRRRVGQVQRRRGGDEAVRGLSGGRAQ